MNGDITGDDGSRGRPPEDPGEDDDRGRDREDRVGGDRDAPLEEASEVMSLRIV